MFRATREANRNRKSAIIIFYGLLFCMLRTRIVDLLLLFLLVRTMKQSEIFGEKKKDKYIYMYMVCSLHLTLIFFFISYSTWPLSSFVFIFFVLLLLLLLSLFFVVTALRETIFVYYLSMYKIRLTPEYLRFSQRESNFV